MGERTEWTHTQRKRNAMTKHLVRKQPSRQVVPQVLGVQQRGARVHLS